MKQPLRKRLLAWLAPVAVVATLGAIFSAYQGPELTIDLANRIWACF